MLLRRWNLVTSDWILVANYAYKLLGYDVRLRRLGHFNVLVKKSKIPWAIYEGIEVHPPRNTKYRNDFKLFLSETGFDFDINLATDEEFKKKAGKYALYTLPNKVKIRVQKPIGAIKEFEKLLSLSTEEGLGVERLDKDIKNIENLMKALSKKGEMGAVRKFQRLLSKFEEAKKARLIKRRFDKEIISGIVAARGKAKGRVKIVDKTTDVGHIGEGDILVTKMTSPTLLVVLPKIGAIVTDFGGKLSHAAILAREIGVPCVVGTQVATKVLKDGDFVGVDGDMGLVRKLGNSKN